MCLLSFSFALKTHSLAEELNDSPYLFRIEIGDCVHGETENDIDRFQTGFLVQGITGIVTALHGVADCNKFSALSTANGVRHDKLQIKKVNIDLDLAVLSSSELADSDQGFKVISLDSDEEVFDNLYMIGHPLGSFGQFPRRAQLSLKRRDLSELSILLPDELKNKLRDRKSPSLTIPIYFLDNVDVLPGDSGAPLITGNDQVIGVINGGLYSGTGGIPWAIPWNEDIHWDTPDVDEFKDLQKHDVTSLFSFRDGKPETDKLIIFLNAQTEIQLEIPLEHKEYDLRRFMPSDFNMPSNITNVVIQRPDRSILAEGLVNQEILAKNDNQYKSFILRNQLGFLSLKIVPARQQLLQTPSSSTTIEFSITVINACDRQIPIQGAEVIFTLKSNADTVDGDSKKKTTNTEGIASTTVTIGYNVQVNVKSYGYMEATRDYDSRQEGILFELTPSSGCPTPTLTPTASTVTPTAIDIVTPTSTFTNTQTPTVITTDTATPTPSKTATRIPPTATTTVIPTPTITSTTTETPTAMATATYTMSSTPTPDPLTELKLAILFYRKLERSYYKNPYQDLQALHESRVVSLESRAYQDLLYKIIELRRSNRSIEQIFRYKLSSSDIKIDGDLASACVAEEFNFIVYEKNQYAARDSRKINTFYEFKYSLMDKKWLIVNINDSCYN